jgi:hypothetical protein
MALAIMALNELQNCCSTTELTRLAGARALAAISVAATLQALWAREHGCVSGGQRRTAMTGTIGPLQRSAIRSPS